MIVIERQRVSRRDGWTVVEAPISNCTAIDRVWFAVEDPHGEHLADVGPEPFVLSLLQVALEAGQDIAVRAPLSSRFYYALESYAIPILVALSRRTDNPILIVPEHLEERTAPGPGVATPVSGGIDSFTVVADHHLGAPPPGYRLTHLTYHNVGAHGRGKQGDRIFYERRHRIRQLAAELELPLVTVDSNLHYFLRHRFQESHTVRQIAAAHALSGLVGRFLFASGVGYRDLSIRRGEPVGHADPALVHLLSTESFECISTGSQYSRVQKTARVSEIEPSYRYLDVCIEPDRASSGMPNCSVCKKCVRTMVTLEILGRLDRYGRVFDLGAWRRIGTRKLGIVLGRNDSFAREIWELARARGYRFRPNTRMFAAGWRMAYALAPLRRKFREVAARVVAPRRHDGSATRVQRR